MVSEDDSFHIIKRVELKNKRGEAEEENPRPLFRQIMRSFAWTSVQM